MTNETENGLRKLVADRLSAMIANCNGKELALLALLTGVFEKPRVSGTPPMQSTGGFGDEVKVSVLKGT